MVERLVITQGEFCVSDRAEAIIETVLGSCVACCLWDAERGIGGMNHMLIAQHQQGPGIVSDLAGVNAMELLINSMIKAGAQRPALQAKVFGGARMIAGLSDVGSKNAAFVLAFLQQEGIRCLAQSLGGTSARRICFAPVSGAVRVRTLATADLVERVVTPPPASTIELFG